MVGFTPTTIQAVDEQIARVDKCYERAFMTYVQARGLIAKARIARGFYPIVILADDGEQAQYGRGVLKKK